ncbi:MAG TPA: threonine dehydratase [Trichormus sp. M33_DOE_039]|nr:threonine dehydratase [Trichormus sp. M33_DOE_039]
MTRLIQIIQNTLIRVIAFSSVILQNIVAFISSIFKAIANLLGLNNPNYFLESEDANSTKKISNQQLSTNQLDNKTEISNSNRRRPNAKMEYYMKMAQEIRKTN